MTNGVKTTNLTRQFAIDEVIGNVTTEGVASTVRIPFSALADQLAGTGTFVFGNTVYAATEALLDASTPPSDTAGGAVFADPDASRNGYYTQDGAGGWDWQRGFPDSVAVLENIGGTANAITADTAAGVNPADVQMIILPDPPGTNTLQTVTITLNGGAAEDIKAASGANLAIGDIIEGVGTLFFRFGSEWRQLFSSATGATFDHQGDYDALTTYTEGQVVTGSDGNWYQLKAASATGDDPVSGGSGDWLLILLGAVIADGSLTEPKYATGSVSTRVLADGAATTDKLGDEAVTEAKILSTLVDDFRYVDPGGKRNKLQYASATSVRIYGKHYPMGGFRVFGQYMEARCPVFSIAGTYQTVSTTTDLAFGTTVKLENWHAVFACADSGDSVPTFKIAPFLYVKSRDVSDVLTLGKCGEQHGVGAGTIDDATYSWAVDELVGAEVLVITDRPSANTNAGFAPRITTVTANTTTTITLADVDEVRDKSMLLLAPKGFDYYRYCASFYVDTAEVRNIYDEGGKVGSRMVNLAFYHENDGGSVSTWLNGSFGSGASSKTLDCQRFIAPLATAIIFQERCQLATSSAVETSSFMDVDGSNHYIGVHRQSKASGSSGPEVTSYSSQFEMPFYQGQNYRNWNSGGGASSRYDVQHNINGWIEA